MNNVISITLPGEPVSKMRPRICKNFSYDPQVKLKKAAKFQILDQVKQLDHLNQTFPIPDCQAVSVSLIFYTSPLKFENNLIDWGITENIFKKDVDNFCKFYLDVMNGIVYADDRQVNELYCRKECSNNPRTEIKIMTQKKTISDQTREILSYIPKEYFCKFAEDIESISTNLLFVESNTGRQKEVDYLEAAYLICEFADKNAETLTKIKKKFPGFAKLLKEAKEKLESK